MNMQEFRTRKDGSHYPVSPCGNFVKNKPTFSPQQLLQRYEQSHNQTEKAKLKRAAISMANRTKSDEWKTTVAKMSTKSPSSMEQFVQKQSALYAKKLDVKQPFEIKINNTMSRLAHVKATRAAGTHEVTTLLEVNEKQYNQCYAADPVLTQRFLDYAMAHEVAHLKQYEEYGFAGAKAMPTFLMEEKADAEAFRVTGITEKEVDSIVKQISTKIQQSKTAPAKTPSVQPTTPSPAVKTPANWVALPKRNGRITFLKQHGHGFVSIDEIPDVDVHTAKITGYTYYVDAQKKSQKFKNYDEAVAAAIKKMEAFN